MTITLVLPEAAFFFFFTSERYRASGLGFVVPKDLPVLSKVTFSAPTPCVTQVVHLCSYGTNLINVYIEIRRNWWTPGQQLMVQSPSLPHRWLLSDACTVRSWLVNHCWVPGQESYCQMCACDVQKESKGRKDKNQSFTSLSVFYKKAFCAVNPSNLHLH